MEDKNKNDKDITQNDNFAAFIESQKLIIREMMHEHRDSVREAAKNHQEEMSRNKRLAIILTVISVVVAVSSVTTGVFMGIQQLNVSRLYKREGWYENRINNWTARDDDLMNAMVNVRDVRDEAQMQCKDYKYVGPDPAVYRRKLKNANYKLIGAGYAIKNTFNLEIQRKMNSFISSSSLDTKVCAKGAANDNILRKNQDEINDLILTSIGDLKQKRDLIMDQIEGIHDRKKDTSNR